MTAHASSRRQGVPTYDPNAPLVPSGNLRRRLVISRVVHGLAMLAAAIAVAALVLVTVEVIVRGVRVISWSFLATNPQAIGLGGGIGSTIIGSTLSSALAR